MGRWTFDDGTGLDSSGRGNAGTLTNGPIPVSGIVKADGIPGNALRFNGTNNYVSVPNVSPLNITGDITVSAWARPTTLNGAVRDVLLKGCNAGNSNNREYGLTLSVSNRWRGLLYVGGGANVIGDVAASAAFLNVWQHVALSRIGSACTLYMNGKPVATASVAGTLDNNQGILAIGRLGGFNAEYFIGDIDDARVYNVGLSGAEVAAIYNEVVSSAFEYDVPAFYLAAAGFKSRYYYDMGQAA